MEAYTPHRIRHFAEQILNWSPVCSLEHKNWDSNICYPIHSHIHNFGSIIRSRTFIENTTFSYSV